ncbi:DUF6999 family protein [Phenylobacterium montanum]|uniref:Uncharacterized protein n=1 Tax=Phenylobacterium montanum TaxID=2823693 RepID=A0A975FYU8_9CAUL|nr:hypothetical protein [Caulobacter sp. S6]QUD87935.1 hypothetical protein KCG34_23335 [Caulobacter sp. S6]
MSDPFDPRGFDPRDPDPTLALYLDQSLPIDDSAKRALLDCDRSGSRRWLFPLIRPALLAGFVVIKGVRAISPRRPNLNQTLHRLIHWGLRTFASPEANLLILRHFHIGTEILAFIKANAGGVEIATTPLRPRTLKDLEANLFLQHDLNVYNFIIQLNAGLRAQGRDLEPVAQPDFSMISDRFEFDPLPNGPLNRIDVQTAVEAYTPLYALLLPRKDFERAASSLQLDEVVGISVAKILGSSYHLAFVKNGHPLVRLSSLQAGYRLMMHGLDCEALHGWLRVLKHRQAQGLPLDPRAPTVARLAA